MDEIESGLESRTAATQLLEPIEQENSSHTVTTQLASVLMALPRSPSPAAVTSTM